jgi:antitoxin (DNA-binding transcriptional repressor) of toxin-antitoxin stability system
MEKVTISKIKNQLSAYLKKVKAGETILICDRDQPVARLERINTEERPDDRISRLEREGLLRRAKHPTPIDALRDAVPKPKRSVLEALLEERKEAR